MNKHILYKTGDKGVPRAIEDGHREVVLSLCKICGRAEAELELDGGVCPGRKARGLGPETFNQEPESEVELCPSLSVGSEAPASVQSASQAQPSPQPDAEEQLNLIAELIPNELACPEVRNSVSELANAYRSARKERDSLRQHLADLTQFLRIVYDKGEQDDLVEWVKEYALAFNREGNVVCPGAESLEQQLAAKDAEIARLNEACAKEFADVEMLSAKVEQLEAETRRWQEADRIGRDGCGAALEVAIKARDEAERKASERDAKARALEEWIELVSPIVEHCSCISAHGMKRRAKDILANAQSQPAHT